MKRFFYFLASLSLLCSCENKTLPTVRTNEVEPKETQGIICQPPFYYDEVYEIRDGKEINLTHQQHAQTKAIQEFYEIATIAPSYIYPGSVLQAESVDKGIYHPVGYPNIIKPEIRISFSLPVKSKSIAPKRSAFFDAITDAIGDKNFSGQQSQVFSYKMKEFNYYKEVKMAFGANVNIGQLFSINTSIQSDRKQSNTALFIDFSQIYFSIAMDIPDDGNIFINESERQKYLGQKPIYINSVNMGRKGVLIVESEESYSEISIAIRAAFNAGIVGGQLSLDDKTKKMLRQANIYIYIIGGDAEEASKVVKGFEAFQEFIVKGGVYSNTVYGVPVSFSAAYASDNSLFISKFDI